MFLARAAVSGRAEAGCVRQLRAVVEYFSLVWKSNVVSRTVGRQVFALGFVASKAVRGRAS